jgi:hypothetical protein
MDTNKNKTGLQDSKTKMDSLPRRSLQEILQQKARSSGTPSKEIGATSKPAVDVSAKGRDEPVMRNLPEVISKDPSLRIQQF